MRSRKPLNQRVRNQAIAIVAFVGIAVGAGGAIAVQQLQLGESQSASVEERVAKVATERDGLDLASVDCSAKPYPKDTYDCEVIPAGQYGGYFPIQYRVIFENERVIVRSLRGR